MSNNRLVWEGLEEFKAALRQLPVELREEGADIVEMAADAAKNEIGTIYTEHKESGNLASHLKSDITRNDFGISVALKSTAKHAHLFEDGSATRKNKAGANRGYMPGFNVFVPTVIRRRRWMTNQLIGLMQTVGLEVSGG